MDYLAHGLWSYIFFHKTKKPWKAVFFGVLPDTLSWMIYFFYILFSEQTFLSRPHPELVPQWVMNLYSVTHSLVIFAVVLGICLFIFKKWKNIPLFIYAYPLHIFMDIPTHSRSFLPTPFLWPISSWNFPGISWGTPWFMIVNYSAILLCIGYIWWNRRKRG